jgi:hypothetical protein
MWDIIQGGTLFKEIRYFVLSTFEYRISLNIVPPWIMSPLNSVPFFEKALYIKKKLYSNFCTFEIASLVNVPDHYLRKYGVWPSFFPLLLIFFWIFTSNLLWKPRYHIEHLTPVDKSLYILINGMMTVRCDGFFLQAIQPNEFINSVEWKCHQYGQTFSTHQARTNLYEYLPFVFLTDDFIVEIDHIEPP